MAGGFKQQAGRCVAQTWTPAVHLRVKQSEVEGTAARRYTALDWRRKIRGFLSFRLHELGLDDEALATRKRHLHQPTSRPQSPRLLFRLSRCRLNRLCISSIAFRCLKPHSHFSLPTVAQNLAHCPL